MTAPWLDDSDVQLYHGSALGIDLSEEYLAIAARRTAQQSLLGGIA